MDPSVAAKYNTMIQKWKGNVAAGKVNLTARNSSKTWASKGATNRIKEKYGHGLNNLPKPVEPVYGKPYWEEQKGLNAAAAANRRAAIAAKFASKNGGLAWGRHTEGVRKTRRGRRNNRKSRKH